MIIVSATIDVGPDVDVADLLGLDQVRKVSLPMDTLPNQAIWIDQSMPMIVLLLMKSMKLLLQSVSRSYLKWNTQF